MGEVIRDDMKQKIIKLHERNGKACLNNCMINLYIKEAGILCSSSQQDLSDLQ